MKQKNKFIVLEGVDGTGKSSICNYLKTEKNFIVLKSPPPPFNKIKQYVLEQSSSESRLMYFLSSNIEISNIVKKNITKSNIISDRYIYSTLAYHMSLEKINLKQLDDLLPLIKKYFIMPDYMIFLKVSRKKQIERCMYKHDDKLQTRLILDDEFQKLLIKNYDIVNDYFSSNIITIDTSYKSINEVVEELHSKIEVCARAAYQ